MTNLERLIAGEPATYNELEIINFDYRASTEETNWRNPYHITVNDLANRKVKKVYANTVRLNYLFLRGIIKFKDDKPLPFTDKVKKTIECKSIGSFNELKNLIK